MKTDFTERLRNFLKEEGYEFRINVDFDEKGKVEMIMAYEDFDDDDFLFFTPPISTHREN